MKIVLKAALAFTLMAVVNVAPANATRIFTYNPVSCDKASCIYGNQFSFTYNEGQVGNPTSFETLGVVPITVSVLGRTLNGNVVQTLSNSRTNITASGISLFFGFIKPNLFTLDSDNLVIPNPNIFVDKNSFIPAVALSNGEIAGNITLIDTTLVGAVPAVPEPSTWAMMILGMGIVGFAFRRRKNERLSSPAI